MTWTHLPRPGRVAAICVALALFVTGSNYCVIGAVRGLPMACTSVGAMASVKSETSAPVCPLHATKPGNSSSSKNRAQGTAPCCMTIARADAPEVPRIDPAPMPLAALAVIAAALDAPRPAVAAHATPLDDETPVPGWDKCAHAGRAPPSLT